jgi:hypothetical protein
MVHELCHTFFYEAVPEQKFQPSKTDSAEEYLCNFGASELLVPTDDLKVQTRYRGACFATLDELRSYYEVSQQMLFFRLKAIGMWKGVALSTWCRSDDGRFMMARVRGYRRDFSWNWHNVKETLWLAWETGFASGRTIVTASDKSGLTGSDPVYFEIVRRDQTLHALWSRKPLRRTTPDAPTLLDSNNVPVNSILDY